jgi:hypothetical protein
MLLEVPLQSNLDFLSQRAPAVRLNLLELIPVFFRQTQHKPRRMAVILRLIDGLPVPTLPPTVFSHAGRRINYGTQVNATKGVASNVVKCG